MAESTTGTGEIIAALLDFLAGRPLRNYRYGINYRQVLSRMIVQLVAKASVLGAAGKKCVWIVQDTLFDYMLNNYKLDLETELNPDAPIVLEVYQLKKDAAGNFDLIFQQRRAGHIETFSQMMRSRRVVTIDEIVNQLEARIRKEKGVVEITAQGPR